MKKGFSLIELMVVVAIIAILAAIALPMYSVYRKKAKASGAIRTSSEAGRVMALWFYETGNLTNLDIRGGTSGKIFDTATDGNLGLGLPDQLENDVLTWTLATTINTATLTWTISGCADCAGTYCLSCDDASGSCDNEVAMVHADLQTLNKGNAC